MRATHEPYCPVPRAEARGETAHCLCGLIPESEPIVWADEASPFTGPQVLDLLAQNTKLRMMLVAMGESIDLLLKGMESQCEQMHELKQKIRAMSPPEIL